MRSTGVGAKFRVERCLEPGDPAAEPRHHLGNDMILANAQAVADDLNRQMAVAEMPGDAQQAWPIRGFDIEDWLGRRAPSISPRVTASSLTPAALSSCARQIEKKGSTRIGDQTDAPPMPV